jgi:hypothetical protein
MTRGRPRLMACIGDLALAACGTVITPVLASLSVSKRSLTDASMPNQSSFRQIQGSCHCGNIRFTLDWPGPGHTIPVRACSCGHCRKHRGVWTSHPTGQFRIAIADASQSGQYQFGTKTADFHVCKTCGIVPIVTCVIEGARYAVVNVNTFDNVDRSELAEAPSNFEGESTESRMTRRRRNWTPEGI